MLVSFLAFNDLGVLRGVIDLCDVFSLNSSRSIFVKKSESSIDNFLLSLREWISQTSKELFIPNIVITVNIVVLNELLKLNFGGE